MRIGIIGLDFGSGNKGCEALGFSFIYLLNELSQKHNEIIEIVVCMKCDTDRISTQIDTSYLKISSITLGRIFEIKRKRTAIEKCDIIFDFTAGDSFSDTYGMKRFVKRTFNKELVLLFKKPLVLGGQTYGPYENRLARSWARHVIKNSYRVFARDELSYEIASYLSQRKDIVLTTDIAFLLPYKKLLYNDGKKHIGINPSGLLWEGGYTRSNQFGLRIDYQQYIVQIISALIDDKNILVHLIPHVLYKDESIIDNDWVLCKRLKKRFPKCILPEYFETPMEAKSYISSMDVFIGARMHATIAAYSSGVPTIAFSYSQKFEGLFGTFNYPYILSGKEITTNEAAKRTLSWITNYNDLKQCIDIYLPTLNGRIKAMKNEYEKLLFSS